MLEVGSSSDSRSDRIVCGVLVVRLVQNAKLKGKSDGEIICCSDSTSKRIRRHKA